ncbi:hypothetical protein ACFFUT_00935 [Pseudohalocynthiibacter aestuariivivens]|uniref:Uncharacterized protein n=1 Tax=Pseudohalocynthiibacter aestuariivivens TaxID=1591409 RepID=A0ABV5JA62_9RHOB|nr:hypothetical protein [Pseudohalocynthiibacter aestuariivivens]MBS9716924.1 hypothetical protein [Pseudohalocynthiibacter aestuariivivens]
MAKKKPRKALSSLVVGSGITTRRRQPSIVDLAYREKAISGALVDSRANVSPAIPFQTFREEVEEYCRNTYESEDLVDPFKFIHPQGKYAPLEASFVLSKGETYLKEKSDLGFLLAANVFCPDEDHSHLWYASRLANELTRLDLISAKVRDGNEPAEALVAYAAHVGSELGGLDKERRMKSEHERNAQLGERQVGGSSRGGQTTAQLKRDIYAEPYEEMNRRIEDGETLSHAARQVVREFDLKIKPQSLVKSYRNNRIDKGQDL